MGGVRYVHQFSDNTNLPTNTSFKWPGCQQASWFGNLGSTMKPQLDIPSGNSKWLAVKSPLNEGFICFNGKCMYKWWIFKPTMFDCWRVSTWITNMWLLNCPSFWEWTSVGTKGSKFLILYSYMRYLAKQRRELKKVINQYHLMIDGSCSTVAYYSDQEICTRYRPWTTDPNVHQMVWLNGAGWKVKQCIKPSYWIWMVPPGYKLVFVHLVNYID